MSFSFQIGHSLDTVYSLCSQIASPAFGNIISLHKRNNSDDFQVNNSCSSSGPRIVVETSSGFIFRGLLFFEGYTFGNLNEFSSSCIEFRNILRPFQGIKHTGCSLFTVRRLIVINRSLSFEVFQEGNAIPFLVFQLVPQFFIGN